MLKKLTVIHVAHLPGAHSPPRPPKNVAWRAHHSMVQMSIVAEPKWVNLELSSVQTRRARIAARGSEGVCARTM